jgi:MFS-type transporter involved in bile tolerance (Atg22 family)
MQQAMIAAPNHSRREQVSWYFYDWANSAFSTTVVTVFLGPYLTAVTQNAADVNGYIYPLGLPILADAFFPYMVSLSVVLQVFFLPVLGAIADYSRLKKQFMGIFAYIGAFATMGMYFLQGNNYLLGGGLFLLANLSFGASIVFYNAFLPDIAPPAERDRVSSQGWAMGYLGGGLCSIPCGRLGCQHRRCGAHQPGFGRNLVGDLYIVPAVGPTPAGVDQTVAHREQLSVNRLCPIAPHPAPTATLSPDVTLSGGLSRIQ